MTNQHAAVGRSNVRTRLKRLCGSRITIAAAAAVLLVAGIVTAVHVQHTTGRKSAIGYFANATGLYNGDDVVILGVPVGKVEKIEPEPDRVKISFSYDARYKIPFEAKAVILSPSLVTPRAIQLTPAYTTGPVMPNQAIIPLARTAVPVEYDDFRQQLEKLTEVLQPDQPGGNSTLGAFINTAADNIRGQGPQIHDTIVKLSQAISALGDHSGDLFTTLKNLSVLASALRDSTGVLGGLNQNLAAVTHDLANDPNEVGQAVDELMAVTTDVRTFVGENKEALGTTTDKLASVSQAANESIDDIKQLLHVAPTGFQNFINIYQPAQGTLSGILALNNFSNPIQFLCGAVQAASRRGAKESAKLCVQYLAPIIKNRQINFLPLAENLFVGATARPNEITYSEDWMRPDYVPPPPPAPPQGNNVGPLPAEKQAAQSIPINPASGLRGMMAPPGGGR